MHLGFIACGWGWTINQLSIDYAASRCLALGPPDPPRMDRAAEPSGFRWARFSLAIRYSYRHSLFRPVHTAFRSCFVPDGTLPYHTLQYP